VLDDFLKNIVAETNEFIGQPNPMRSLLILVIAIIVAYWLSNFVAKALVKFAQAIAVRSDNATSEERTFRLRRVETYLSVAVALVRALIVATVAYVAWRALSESSSPSAAAIGASAFVFVIAGATIGMILRDITAGVVMIVERWYHVGDYISVEPFMEVSGVVERMTLRSTKLRSLSGEVVWLHNQHIQGVKVTPRGLRTIAVDIFVNNQRVGETLINKAIETIPVGTMKVAQKPEIVMSEKWGEKLWLFTVVGETPPGREWLLENYFVDSLKELDDRRKGPKTFIRPPIVRYADAAAERSFKRAVRMQKKAN
jgi:hypothetical protein